MSVPWAVTRGGGHLAQDVYQSMMADLYGNWRALGQGMLIALAERAAEEALGNCGRPYHGDDCVSVELLEEQEWLVKKLEGQLAAARLVWTIRP